LKVRALRNIQVERLYRAGDVFEMPDEHARIAVEKDRTAEYAPEDAPLSAGTPREIDPLEAAILRGDLAAAKELGAGIKVPPAELDPQRPAPPAILPTDQIRQLDDFGGPGGV
jgi:hypothetical protein